MRKSYMGVDQSIVFYCDSCDVQYTVADTMEVPPDWIAVQVAAADSEGAIPPHERDVYNHFCGIECLKSHIRSEAFNERIIFANKPIEEDENDNDDGGTAMGDS